MGNEKKYIFVGNENVIMASRLISSLQQLSTKQREDIAIRFADRSTEVSYYLNVDPSHISCRLHRGHSPFDFAMALLSYIEVNHKENGEPYTIADLTDALTSAGKGALAAEFVQL